MIASYLTTAVRNLSRQRIFSLINLFGLALGLACAIGILLFIRDELSFDTRHPAADRLHRLWIEIRTPDQAVRRTAMTAPPMGPAVAAELSGVEATTRLLSYFQRSEAGVRYEDRSYFEPFFWAEPTAFELFDLDLVEGDEKTALARPFSLVLSRAAAERLFGGESPLGKIVRLDGGFSEDDYMVTGILADRPPRSHVKFELLASFASVESFRDERLKLSEWRDFLVYTYLRLAPGVSPRGLEQGFPALVTRHMGERLGKIVNLHLQPVTDIHLRSHLNNEIEPNNDIAYIYILALVAVFTLVMASINYMNLATARLAGRAKEVGVRKVIGAHRSDLALQFLIEAMLLALASLLLALVLIQLSLPAFNAFTGKEMRLGVEPDFWLGLLGITIFVGLLAGSYPALLLSALKPVAVLKGVFASGTKSGALRKALVIVQFAFSVALIASTLIVFGQLRFMRGHSQAVLEAPMLVLPVRDISLKERYETVKTEIKRLPNVLGVAISAQFPGQEAPEIASRLSVGEVKMMGSLFIDHDFLDLLGYTIVAGRGFSPDSPQDATSSFLLNQSAVRECGWKTPQEAIGQSIQWGGRKSGEVVGVVADFYQQPLRFAIKPLVLHIWPIGYKYLLVKVRPDDLPGTIAALESTWRKVFPGRPFEYTFLDQELDRLYRSEEQLGNIFGFFAAVAIVVACLGLLGLAAFTAEQRTKEIGVRKVLGSSVPAVVGLLSREFTLLVLISIALALPLATLAMQRWLEGFAYRAAITPGQLVASGALALAIAWITVALQAFKIAIKDPVETLRYE